MKTMTSKERVLRAINHQPVDRIPLDLGGMACSIVDEEYFRLRDYLGIQGDIAPFRRGTNCSYYDERILDYFDIDIRRVFATEKDAFPRYLNDGTFVNEWGIIRRKTSRGTEFVRSPLEDAEIEDLDGYPWPKFEDFLEVGDMKERARQLSEKNQYAVSLRGPMNGIFEIACWLRGMENFMVDMIENEEFADRLCEKILDVQMKCYGRLLDEVGEYVDIVETGDDYGSQNSLLISPKHLNKFILSRRARLNAMIRKKAPCCKIFLHSCGSISGCIDDLTACGVDILNPVQITARDMDPFMLKERFGDKICFHGGVDTQQALRSDKTAVRREVKKMLDALNHNGGYILSCCNHIQADIPVENVVEMFRVAKELSNH